MGTDGIHLVFLFTFDEVSGLRNEVGAKLRCLNIQKEEVSMEDSKHLPS